MTFVFITMNKSAETEQGKQEKTILESRVCGTN